MQLTPFSIHYYIFSPRVISLNFWKHIWNISKDDVYNTLSCPLHHFPTQRTIKSMSRQIKYFLGTSKEIFKTKRSPLPRQPVKCSINARFYLLHLSRRHIFLRASHYAVPPLLKSGGQFWNKVPTLLSSGHFRLESF